MIKLILFLILLPVVAFADVLGEFNGVKWKSKFPRQGFKLILKSDSNLFYSRTKSDDLYGIPVKEVVYTVDKGVFNKAHAVLDATSYGMVRQYLVKNYGQPVKVADRELFVVKSNGRTSRAMLQSGLVNFSYQDK